MLFDLVILLFIIALVRNTGLNIGLLVLKALVDCLVDCLFLTKQKLRRLHLLLAGINSKVEHLVNQWSLRHLPLEETRCY